MHPYTNQLLYIKRNVINVLLRNSNSDPFKVPVDPEVFNVPQYPKFIKCPMDFGTIKTKLDKQVYQTANECKSDFLDVFRNCYIFNEPDSLYVEMALKLENLFKRKMADLPVPEHYVPDTAFHTPKSNKVKKGKLMKLHTPLSVKSKLSSLVTSTPINNLPKSDISVNQKRIRSESSNGYSKDEPTLKKSKIGIDLKQCKHIILSLVSKKYNDWNRYFLEPVDVEGLKLHDYYEIVKKPMDLGTVKRKLFEGSYQSNEEFEEEVKLIFKNCYLYNPDGHEVHRCGKLLENVFIKLYQGVFTAPKKIISAKPVKIQQNCEDLQPLLTKILKRQAEIDSLHLDIIKRNKEIQQLIDYINGTDLIKSFKANANSNHKSLNSTIKKPASNSVNHEQKSERSYSPKPMPSKSIITPESKNDSYISKPGSNHQPTQSKPTEITKSPKPMPQKTELVKEPQNRLSESKRTIKPSFKSQMNAEEEIDKRSMTTQKKQINHINNNQLTDNCVNSFDTPQANPSKSQQKMPPVEPVKADPKKTTKNSEEFNAQLKEIKAWTSSLSADMAVKVREFITKSENKAVVSVSLLKLKPATINGLYKMMTEASREAEKVCETRSQLREFTIEDRMQLSQDLRLLGEKCSEKILNIYKKTEDVQSSDGECEIDFQTMKLVTLHSLRDFANKCLEKKREKQLKKGAVTAGQPVGNNGADSDSDSSDSSGSDSDSNSDASSSSSSDNEFFNNLSKTATIAPDTSQPVIAHPPPLLPPPRPVLVQETPQPSSEPSFNETSQLISNSDKVHHHIVDSTQEESHLSDSSDSDKSNDDDDDDDDDKVDSTSKRPIYSTLWNKSSNSDLRKPTNTPISKPQNISTVPNPMINNQLSESLRQIVQDAQAHENVKKQEEELRLGRMKEEEELKKQHQLRMQAFNESRKQLNYSENQKKEEELLRLKETIANDRKQRAIDIPCAPEREDYHQILCDFEYNIDQELIMKLVHIDPRQVHL